MTNYEKQILMRFKIVGNRKTAAMVAEPKWKLNANSNPFYRLARKKRELLEKGTG